MPESGQNASNWFSVLAIWIDSCLQLSTDQWTKCLKLSKMPKLIFGFGDLESKQKRSKMHLLPDICSAGVLSYHLTSDLLPVVLLHFYYLWMIKKIYFKVQLPLLLCPFCSSRLPNHTITLKCDIYILYYIQTVLKNIITIIDKQVIRN